MGATLHQLRWMLWKNCTLKIRNKKAVALEMGYPLYFLLILWLMTFSLQTTKYPEVPSFPSAAISAACPGCDRQQALQAPNGLLCLFREASELSKCGVGAGAAKQPFCECPPAENLAGLPLLGFSPSGDADAAAAAAAAAAVLGGPAPRAFGSAAELGAWASALARNKSDTRFIGGVAFAPSAKGKGGGLSSYTIRLGASGVTDGGREQGNQKTASDSACRPFWRNTTTTFVTNPTGGQQGLTAVQGEYSAQQDKAGRTNLPTACPSSAYISSSFVALQVHTGRLLFIPDLISAVDPQVISAGGGPGDRGRAAGEAGQGRAAVRPAERGARAAVPAAGIPGQLRVLGLVDAQHLLSVHKDPCSCCKILKFSLLLILK